MKERVHKLIAQAGLASRRAAEDMIAQGRVRVNGQLAKVGDQADPQTDVITVDGRRLSLKYQPRTYIALYKPRNVISTNEGHRGDPRRTVRDLVPFEGHLFTIGRLDADSEGLMVLTNDGDLANKLSHPRYQHTKTYRVVVEGLPAPETIERWENGVQLEEGPTAPAVVRIIKGARDYSTLRIVMTEGKKRQIRRVAQLLGHRVRRLIRTRIGMLELGNLKPGEWRELSAQEVELLSTPSPEIKLLRRRAAQSRRHNARRGRQYTSNEGVSAETETRRARSRRTTTFSTDEAAERPARTYHHSPAAGTDDDAVPRARTSRRSGPSDLIQRGEKTKPPQRSGRSKGSETSSRRVNNRSQRRRKPE